MKRSDGEVEIMQSCISFCLSNKVDANFYKKCHISNTEEICFSLTKITPKGIYMLLKHIYPLELVQQILVFPVSVVFLMIVYSKACFKHFSHSLIGETAFLKNPVLHEVQPTICFPLLSVFSGNITSCSSQLVLSLHGG